MNPNNPSNERLVYRSQHNDKPSESMSKDRAGFHYVKNHGYAHREFADQGEVTQFNGIRVVDESASEESEDFEDFRELNQSDWTINSTSGARLSDGTILYEGRQ